MNIYDKHQPLVSDQVTVTSTDEELLLDFHLSPTHAGDGNIDNRSTQRIILSRAAAESFAAELQAATNLYSEKPGVKPERFFGLWSDMSDDEQVIFEQIQQERAAHFDRDLPQFDAEQVSE